MTQSASQPADAAMCPPPGDAACDSSCGPSDVEPLAVNATSAGEPPESVAEPLGADAARELIGGLCETYHAFLVRVAFAYLGSLMDAELEEMTYATA